ncbi:cell wall hydrolase [Brevundimonas sp. UBA2416]|uniref:cell wall hydrolase n=1 Tax=Brevundimonas sp. UBA2416 TaxID=1946124 RepID=UPI0025C0B062|nr:cell wall hydrolase [Brevundimonas sp. UBA2416]
MGLAIGCAYLGGTAAKATTVRAQAERIEGATAAGFTEEALAAAAGGLDESALTIARRHDPYTVAGGAQRDRQAELLTARLEQLRGQPTDATLRRVNLTGPVAALPFRLGSTLDASRDLDCLTQAAYYEARGEGRDGMRAVTQVVLNRVRHAAFPNSVCGVVFQGAGRRTGCQFSFTCDGSLARAPDPTLWERARSVAKRALGGYVLKSVGTATHYHADYVAPYWAPTLYKINTIGRHIFYRWTGPWGLPPAFTGKYAGGENNLSLAILEGLDARTQGGQLVGETVAGPAATRTLTLAVDGETRTYTVQDLVALPPGQELPRVQGALAPARRQPTAQEIADINARLKAMEDPDAPIRTAPSAPPADSGDLPIATRRN